MTDDELQQVDAELREIASALGLDWVTTEVDRSISEGYPEERLRRGYTDDNPRLTPIESVRYSRNTNKESHREKPIIVVRPMTMTEQVRQLAVALRVILVDGPRKEIEIVKNLADTGQESLTISFTTESPRGVGEPDINNIGSDTTHQEQLDTLATLFNQLIEQIDAPS